MGAWKKFIQFQQFNFTVFYRRMSPVHAVLMNTNYSVQ